MTLGLCHHQQYNPTGPVWLVLSPRAYLSALELAVRLASAETNEPHSHTWAFFIFTGIEVSTKSSSVWALQFNTKGLPFADHLPIFFFLFMKKL